MDVDHPKKLPELDTDVKKELDREKKVVDKIHQLASLGQVESSSEDQEFVQLDDSESDAQEKEAIKSLS